MWAMLTLLVIITSPITLLMIGLAYVVGKMLRSGTEGDVSKLPLHLSTADIKGIVVPIVVGMVLIAIVLFPGWLNPLAWIIGIPALCMLAWPGDIIDRTDPDNVIDVTASCHSEWEPEPENRCIDVTEYRRR